MPARVIAKGVLALVVCVSIGGVVSADASAGWDCDKRVWVIGARGSGEKPDHEQGKVVGNFGWRLEKVAGKTVVGGDGLGYPAVSVYDWGLLSRGLRGVPGKVGERVVDYKQSVDQGVQNLVDKVKERAGACEHQKIVLAGFSQGAQVIRQSLPHLKGLAKHVGAVVLFGDPGFKAGTWADKGGTFDPGRKGILSE